MCEAPFKVLEGRICDIIGRGFWKAAIFGAIFKVLQSTVFLCSSQQPCGQEWPQGEPKLTVFSVQATVEKQTFQQTEWDCHKNVWKKKSKHQCLSTKHKWFKQTHYRYFGCFHYAVLYNIPDCLVLGKPEVFLVCFLLFGKKRSRDRLTDT